MDKGFSLGKIFGVEVSVHWSWVILAALVVSSLATGWFPVLVPGAPSAAYWISGVIGALGLFISILVHEMSHAVVGRSFQIPMTKISLFLFGGVAQMDDEPVNAKSEFFMAAAGPLTSLILAIAFWSILPFTITPNTNLLTALVEYLASINIVVAVFNMLPGYPLDGGRVLRAALWAYKKDLIWATRISAGVGQVFGAILIGFGAFRFLMGESIGGLWMAFLGLMVMGFARNSYLSVLVKKAFQGKTASSFMQADAGITTRCTLISDLASSRDHVLAVVDEDGQIAGVVDLLSAQKFPRGEWSQHVAQEIIEPCSDLHLVERDMSADKALIKMSRGGFNELFVMDHGRLVGILKRAALLRYLTAQNLLES